MVVVEKLFPKILRDLNFNKRISEHDGMVNRAVSIRNRAYDEYCKGLSRKHNAGACVKMLPTFVTELPKGNEVGTFIALDLGGTNFRVLKIVIEPSRCGEESQIDMDSKIYKMDSAVVTGNREQLFGHIASCIADFLQTMQLTYREHPRNHDGSLRYKIPIGFTFSFPCQQKSLKKSTLIKWTKGFNASDCVGRDIGEMLSAEIAKRDDLGHLQVNAICNDTVGTLMSCAFSQPNCAMGLIVGTGTNVCYRERVENIEMLRESEKKDVGEHMIVNTENGNMGSDGLFDDIITSFDQDVDLASPNPGQQIYEKLISGMYLGELTRRIMLCLYQNGELFKGDTVAEQALRTPNIINAQFLAKVAEADTVNDIVTIQNAITEKFEVGALRKDCEKVYRLCHAVSDRAATLCAAGISALALKIAGTGKTGSCETEQHLVCAVDGSVYRKHPVFRKTLVNMTSELLDGTNICVDFVVSQDGSGKGAALTVAAAARGRAAAVAEAVKVQAVKQQLVKTRSRTYSGSETVSSRQ